MAKARTPVSGSMAATYASDQSPCGLATCLPTHSLICLLVPNPPLIHAAFEPCHTQDFVWWPPMATLAGTARDSASTSRRYGLWQPGSEALPIEAIYRARAGPTPGAELELLVKWRGHAHIHCQWVCRHACAWGGMRVRRGKCV